MRARHDAWWSADHRTRAIGRRMRNAAGPRDVLIVVSKLKHYVRETTGMNTSDDVIEVLSDRVRELCDAAVEQARAAGRKTIMARDFRRRPSD
jgi:histone H3/H4